MTRKTALVIAPGRGTYNKEELGYFGRYHADKADLLTGFDARRAALGQETLSALDGAAKYALSTYSRGDNASGLIYACAYADFLSIDRDAYDIVAVTGNSMGWYIALACAGALDARGGFEVVNTMGTLMHEGMIGGQTLYPFVDDNWVEIPGKRQELLALVDDIDGLHVSIELGGMIVFAGDDAALKEAEGRLPPVQERFPMRLANHAGFHSSMQAPISAKGKAALDAAMFSDPALPLIDGRGHVWHPRATDVGAMWDYTLGHQVVETYDFTRAIQNGMREFAPDTVIVLGPGATLGGAVMQSLIACGWRGMNSKEQFLDQQASAPAVISMGIDSQRGLAVSDSV